MNKAIKVFDDFGAYPVSTPDMTTSSINGYVATGTIGYFDTTSYTGNIYQGQTGTLTFPAPLLLQSFTVGVIPSNAYYVSRVSPITFFLNNVQVHTMTYNSRDSAGQTIALPSGLIADKVVCGYGSGSDWGAGQATRGIKLNGLHL